MCPERHLDAAELLGSEVRNPKKADAGKITADVMRRYMDEVINTYLSTSLFKPLSLSDRPACVCRTSASHIQGHSYVMDPYSVEVRGVFYFTTLMGYDYSRQTCFSED